MFDRFTVLRQYALPKQRLTLLAGRIARARGDAMTTRLIRWLVARYWVDMSEAENPDIASYDSFNGFFSRPLRKGIRPLAHADFVCPVDGAISVELRECRVVGHRFPRRAIGTVSLNVSDVTMPAVAFLYLMKCANFRCASYAA
jgi:hypothetical protein